MNRRHLCRSLLWGLGSANLLKLGLGSQAQAALSDMKITRIRIYNPGNTNGLSGWINQSAIIVTVETDAGITGIGQGGTRDLLEDVAGVLIGEDPFRIEYLWQKMYRNEFYPPGREKLHALGALDCALWDIKAKALDVPVYQLLGGRTRAHIECYQSYGTLSKDNARAAASAVMADGFRAVRFHGIDYQAGGIFNARQAVDATAEVCAELRAGVGPTGDWILDAHTRFDLPDALRLIKKIEPLNPFFVEDPIRAINDTVVFERLRNQVSVPLAVGEQFADISDGIQPFVEAGLIDYLRAAMPNVGGISAYMKIAALCELHSVGLVPHFTAPIATAAVTHALFSSSGPVLNEVLRGGPPDYLDESYDLRDGKIWPNDRPGLGVVLNTDRINLIAEIDAPRTDGLYQGESYIRPDGSYIYL
ncbi:MAG: mandelate racemase/muconate lactonizing enzyme family protein [Pseudomonadales bacterium]|nr:mandelate racemase/muconate lactonizing enzyme family protein [Pseudomonadales bacterium]